MVRAQVEGPREMRVSQGIPKTDEVVVSRAFAAARPQTQQRHRTLRLASIQRPWLRAVVLIVRLCDNVRRLELL